MKPQEISRWIREEHDAVDKLARELQAQVAMVPRTQIKTWIQETQASLRRFDEHLVKHFALEEQDGYLEAVVERRPTLALEVDRLRRQHSELSRVLGSIRRDLEPITDVDTLLIEDSCIRIQTMLRFIADHESRENLIIISVFTSDLGTKD